MAYFSFLSQVPGEDLLESFEHLLEEAGLKVSQEFSNPAHIYAEDKAEGISSQSVVKVLISWSDKKHRQCSVEIRSDEPFLKKDTHCKRVTSALHSLLPSKSTTNQVASF